MRKATRRAQQGQGASEYILAVFLIAVVCIATVTLFGDRVRELFGMSADSVNGTSTPGGKRDDGQRQMSPLSPQ